MSWRVFFKNGLPEAPVTVESARFSRRPPGRDTRKNRNHDDPDDHDRKNLSNHA